MHSTLTGRVASTQPLEPALFQRKYLKTPGAGIAPVGLPHNQTHLEMLGPETFRCQFCEKLHLIKDAEQFMSV